MHDNAGTSITLLPGFTAIGDSAPYTFVASIPPQPPSNVSVSESPTPGLPGAESFTFVWSSPYGYSDIGWTEMEFNNYNHPDNGCFLGFWPGSQSVGLADNNGVTWPGTGVIGSGTLSNSQCQVNLAASSYNPSGNNVSVTLSITFSSSFAGTQEIWMPSRRHLQQHGQLAANGNVRHHHAGYGDHELTRGATGYSGRRRLHHPAIIRLDFGNAHGDGGGVDYGDGRARDVLAVGGRRDDGDADDYRGDVERDLHGGLCDAVLPDDGGDGRRHGDARERLVPSGGAGLDYSDAPERERVPGLHRDSQQQTRIRWP